MEEVEEVEEGGGVGGGREGSGREVVKAGGRWGGRWGGARCEVGYGSHLHLPPPSSFHLPLPSTSSPLSIAGRKIWVFLAS